MSVAWPAPSRYLSQCRNVVNLTLGNKFKLNLNWNVYIVIQENAFENVVWFYLSDDIIQIWWNLWTFQGLSGMTLVILIYWQLNVVCRGRVSSRLFQAMMTCFMYNAKPLPEPMLTYFQLNPKKQSSLKFESKCNDFYLWKCICKAATRNDFVVFSRVFQGKYSNTTSTPKSKKKKKILQKYTQQNMSVIGMIKVCF